MSGEISRRGALCGAAALALAGTSSARGRSQVGGRAQLRVPWPVASIDPHKLDDAAAAIFGNALFDGLYTYTDTSSVAPALAEAEPELVGDEVRVKLRAGIVTALGHALTARDVTLSIARARSLGAAAWLADVPSPKRIDDSTISFATRDPQKLAHTLASPLLVIVPSGFSDASPDGTGPMRADHRGGALVLSRNPRSARAPSFLDEVSVALAPDLSSSLRAFEAGGDDLGWLGLGLHEPRAGAKSFDGGPCAWAILRTGALASAWDSPGNAQRLCDGIAPTKLAYLGLGAAWTTDKDEGWGGAPCELLVRDDSPWLVELARAVAATLSRAGHEVVPKPISAADFSSKRGSRAYALAVDVVRAFSPGAIGALAGLSTSSDPTSAADAIRHPPRLGDVSVRTLPRTLRVGILGEVRAQGGRVAELSLPTSADGTGVDWGQATRGPRR